MPAQIKPTKNIIEQAEGVVSDALERTKNETRGVIQTVARDVSSQISWEKWLGLGETLSPEDVKAKEEEDFMRKLEGYKEIFRKIDAIEGRVTDEGRLDEKVRRYIEEEKKRVTESYSEMKAEHKTQASQLSTPQERKHQQAKEEQQKKAAGEEEEKRKKEEEKARLETQIEAPPGKQTGLSFVNKRRKNPPRTGAPRATMKLRSAETRQNRE